MFQEQRQTMAYLVTKPKSIVGNIAVCCSTVLLCCLLPCFTATSNSQTVPCEILLKYSYDQYRGLQFWEQFPKLEVIDDDPLQNYLSGVALPLADKIWRFLNRLPSDANIETTRNVAIRIRSVRDFASLPGDKSLYVPVSELLSISLDLNSKEKMERAASEYLAKRIEAGAKIITSFVFGVANSADKLHAGYMSPILSNIDLRQIDIPANELAASFFELFTNIRISDNWFIWRQFAGEYSNDCLNDAKSSCRLLLLGRVIYDHINEFKYDTRPDLTQKLCTYIER